MGSDSVEFGRAINSNNPLIPAARSIGKEIKNEYLAEDSLSKSRSIPPAIVEPDREIPGKRAKI
jgi:hypothetical protein